MDLTTWLDVAIGLTLVYLGVSLFVTIINEYIAQMLNLRGRELHAALKKLIDDKTIKKTLTQHPALESFFNNQPGKASSYVDPKILGQLLVGSLSTAATTHNTMNQISEAIDNLPDSSLKAQLQSIYRTAGSTTENLVAAVSEWMDRSLTMMGEQYKRNLQVISFAVGLVITVFLNINTITLTEQLYRDKELRSATTARAIQITEHTTKETFEKCKNLSDAAALKDPACTGLKELTDTIQQHNQSLGKLPIGWSDTSVSFEGTKQQIFFSCAQHIFGWLLTALAVSLGAPFWFDLLNKAVSMRHGMRKPG